MRTLVVSSFLLTSLISLSAQDTDKKVWSLSEMIEYATLNNISVKQAELNEQTAAINLKQSKAALFPSLNASTSQSLNKGTSADPITYEYVSSTIHSTSVGLNAQVNLYNGSKTNNTIKQSGLLAEQSEFLAQETKNSITLSLTEAYLQALYYKEGIDIGENNLKASAEQLKRSEALYNAGSASAKDLSDMKSQHADAQYTLVAAKNSFAKQVLAIKQLLEFQPDEDFELDIPEIKNNITITIPDKIEVYKNALTAMPEIKSGELQREIETLDLKIAKAGYQPILSLNAGLTTGYTNTQQFSFEDQFQNNFYQRLGLTLSIPIFNNYKTKASVQQAQIAIRSSELSLLAEKKEIYQKIETAHQSLVAALSEMEAIEVQMEAAQTSYELSKQQYDLGLVNTVDMLISQNNYLTAQQRFIQSKYTTILYDQLLKFYQGKVITI
jgi:outer membrane protein